jgi:hypothetical protein
VNLLCGHWAAVLAIRAFEAVQPVAGSRCLLWYNPLSGGRNDGRIFWTSICTGGMGVPRLGVLPANRTAKGGVNPGVTPGFKAALTAAINVAVIQGLSPALSPAMSSVLSAAVNRA